MKLFWIVLSATALAGCSPAAVATTALPTPQKSVSRTPVQADCTRAAKLALVAKGTGYAFSPATLTLQRGAFIAVTNKSGSAHPLRATPDAGMAASTLAAKERQVIQFPREGTFTLTAAGATMHLTVAGESGCGTPAPALTISATGRFTPATATVKATENFTVTNHSNQPQPITCTPGSNTDHTRLEPGETQILALDDPGHYSCGNSLTKIAVTVTAAQ